MLYENKILLKFKIQINKYLIINLLFVRLASHYHRENSSLCCSASSPASTNVFWKAVKMALGERDGVPLSSLTQTRLPQPFE